MVDGIFTCSTKTIRNYDTCQRWSILRYNDRIRYPLPGDSGALILEQDTGNVVALVTDIEYLKVGYVTNVLPIWEFYEFITEDAIEIIINYESLKEDVIDKPERFGLLHYSLKSGYYIHIILAVVVISIQYFEN
jgi:hypothetical protein